MVQRKNLGRKIIALSCSSQADQKSSWRRYISGLVERKKADK